MTANFVKLFSTITDSSIWCEDSDTKVVWVTMLAMSDQFGRVSSSLPGLSKRANVNLEKTKIAIEKFLAPDEHSRTKDHGGRRIETIPGGWRLLNYEFYRELRHEEDRREQNRQSQARRRLRIKNSQQIVSNSQQSQPPSAQAEAEAYKENTEVASLPSPFLEKKPPFKASSPMVTAWCRAFQAFFGQPYKIQKGDEKAAQEILTIPNVKIEFIIKIAQKAWELKDLKFFCKHSITIRGFVSKFMEIQNEIGELKKTVVKHESGATLSTQPSW